jgi:hypothetical protein
MRLQIAFARALRDHAAAHFRAGYARVEATSSTEADLQSRPGERLILVVQGCGERGDPQNELITRGGRG